MRGYNCLMQDKCLCYDVQPLKTKAQENHVDFISFELLLYKQTSGQRSCF